MKTVREIKSRLVALDQSKEWWEHQASSIKKQESLARIDAGIKTLNWVLDDEMP